MKVVAVVGSPRKEGNTEFLTEKLLEEVRAEGGKTLIYTLADMRMEYCRGCHTCLREGTCIIDDDLERVKEDMLDAQGIVWASPTQALTLSGRMKTLVDRCILFVFKQSLLGKHGAFISVGGFYGAKKATKYMAETAWAMGISKVGYLEAFAWDKGTVENDSGNIDKTKRLGKKLVHAINDKKDYLFQRMLRNLTIKRLFKDFIPQDPNRMPMIHDYWKEKRWL